MDPDHVNHEQKIAYARASLWIPFYAVGMAARIHGDIPTGLLKAALRKLQILYPPLASRVRIEKDGSAWLTTEGVGECPLEIRPRISNLDWAKIFLEQERIPFTLGRGPIARFFLLRGDQSSDLVAIAPHVVCDGYSLTHVMSDVVELLNDGSRVVTPPMHPPSVTWQTVPHSVRDNLLLRGLVRVLNRAWQGYRVTLGQDEYEELYRCYWARQQNSALVFELSQAETSGLVARCRRHDVSVTGAIVAAFILAMADFQPATQVNQCEISVAVNIRNRMKPPPVRVMGVYASIMDLKMRFKADTSFWELAKQGHTRIHRGLSDRPRLMRTLVLEELQPSIADAFVTALSTDHWNREFELLARFIKVRGSGRWLDVSNIGRIDLPELGTPFRLENLMPLPPLVPGVGLALALLTLGGRMNMILRFRQNELDSSTVSGIRDRALSYLSSAY